jgi:hypothetical protein
MAKHLLHHYTFTPSTNTIVFDGIYARERFLLITNATDEQQLYVFNDNYSGFVSVVFDYDAETTTVVVKYDCSAMSDTDKLQVFIEIDSQLFEPSSTFTDPVSKLRVSEPENLIDTDFEYSLQSTRWETLELTKNIPTFFNRNGDIEVPISDMTIQTGSKIVDVTTSEAHGFQRGQPILISGSSLTSCDGGFIVSSVPTTTSFTYISKAVQASGDSIVTAYTQVFPGSLYSGTEFKLENVGGIVSNAASPSTLTVNTTYPTNFTPGTSLALSNTYALSDVSFSSDNVDINNSTSASDTRTNNDPTGETSRTLALGSAQPYQVTTSKATSTATLALGGGNSLFFTPGDFTISGNQLSFPGGHGLLTGQGLYYVPGILNTAIGGLSERGYWITINSATNFSLYTNLGRTVIATLNGSEGTNAGVCKSAFLYAVSLTGVNNTTADQILTVTQRVSSCLGAANNANSRHVFWGVSAYGTAVNAITNFLTQAHDPAYDYYVKVGTTTSYTISATAGGAKLNLSASTADGLAIPITNAADAYSLFFPSHGLPNNATVTFTSTSTPPTGLVSGNDYSISVVNSNRVRLVDNGSTVVFTSAGAAASVFQLDYSIPRADGDTVNLSGNTFSNNDPLVYNNGGGTDIGGLVNGTTYFVARKSGNRFRLSSALPIISSRLTFTNLALTAQVDVPNDRLTFSGHSIATGTAVIFTASVPPRGIFSDTVYFARSESATQFSLYYTAAQAVTGGTTGLVQISGLGSGIGFVDVTNLIDLTSTPSGQTQSFAASFVGAADGNYEVVTTASDQLSFTLLAPGEVLPRPVSNSSQASFDSKKNALYAPEHGYITGNLATLTLTGDTNIAGVTSGVAYYIIKQNKDWIALATTAENASLGTAIDLTPAGSVSTIQNGTWSLSSNSITGELSAQGTISITNGSTLVTGDGTSFRSLFTPGDIIRVSIPETIGSITLTSVATNVITSATHSLATGDPVRFTGTVLPTNLLADTIYYVRVISATTFTVHFGQTDATNNTNIIAIPAIGTAASVREIIALGSTFEGTVSFVNGNSQLTLTQPATVTSADTTFFASTSLVVRADGQTLHRPYDGGVELIVSTNPDSKMVRQTRRYFRYQSGKGIQVSFAVNFSPSSECELFSASGAVGTITTRVPHRLSVGLFINTSGATNASNLDIWNATVEVLSIIDSYTFTVQLSGTPLDATAIGLSQFHVVSWSGSSLSCGLFDDQNGLFYEFDGATLFACRRNSTTQISGSVALEFRSGEINGTGTRFISQVSVNDDLVIKGQTYQVTRIDSDERLFISPSFQGTTIDGAIISKVRTLRVPQSEWNIDKCDGTGPSGFFLNTARIQMAYLDYSWYGAGKVRFGFKDQNGDVFYCHSFIHGNKEREAYMRSGNLPARYEVKNIGTPTYVAALAHWGTSVIMDGRFDTDEAYIFNGSSNNISLTGANSLTVSARVETVSNYTQRLNNQNLSLGNGLLLAADSSTFNAIAAGSVITGAGLGAGTTVARVPANTNASPYQPYMPSIASRIAGSRFTESNRSLLLISPAPVTTAGAASNYTVTLGDNGAVTKVQPLISIRLAPSVDNGTPGFLGEREIINRMQLILAQVGVISTHTTEITLILNGELSSNSWQRVNQPSLCQLIYHTGDDTVVSGSPIFSFRAQGSPGTANRTPVLTTQALAAVVSLGNAILGGNGTFPDGPDVVTIAATLQEDPSSVSITNPYIVSGRLSWSESQA